MSKKHNTPYQLLEGLSPFDHWQHWFHYLAKGRPVERLQLDEICQQGYIIHPQRHRIYYGAEYLCPLLMGLATWSLFWPWQIIAVAFGYLLPRSILLTVVYFRRRRLSQSILYLMNMLLITMQLSGNLERVLMEVMRLIRYHQPQLSEELSQLYLTLMRHSDREAAWQQFSTRFQSKDFSAIINMIHLNQEYGKDSLESLEEQMINFHDQRLLRINESIVKTDLYFKVLNVICFLPVVGLTLFAPIFYQGQHQLSTINNAMHQEGVLG